MAKEKTDVQYSQSLPKGKDMKRAPFKPLTVFFRQQAIWWLILVAGTMAITLLLQKARLPSARLLGPMIAGIVMATFGRPLRLPARLFAFGQGTVGCMMSRGITIAMLARLAESWPLFLGGVVWAVLIASILGWILTKMGLFPGTTAVWGMSPGGASTMTIMSQEYGADMRLVAFMQYVRVVCVALAASIVAKVWLWDVEAVVLETVHFPPVNWNEFGKTLLVIFIGVYVGKKLRVPAGALLCPMALSVVVNNAGWMSPELPPWFLTFSYALVGWSIGLRFTKQILKQTAKAFPVVFGSTMCLIVLCALYAVFLVVFAGIDPLTAYLASSPGGADSVAIIAASSPVDRPFVMAMQTARLLLVLAVGPFLARRLAKRYHIADKV